MRLLRVPDEGPAPGLDVEDDPRGVHAAIGYLPDFFGLYDELTIRQSLTYAARSRGVAQVDVAPAVEAAAARVQLTERLDQRAGELSRGLRQRLAIGQTVVHRPQVLLLDEPAAGLDPEARRSLSDLILKLAAEGMTIVVSSHILAELEDYCTQMLMIRDGQVAGGGVVAAGGAISDQTLIEVSFTDPPSDLLARLTALGLKTAANTASSAVLHLDPGQTESDLIAILIGAGLKVRAFGPARNSLEAAYLAEAKR